MRIAQLVSPLNATTRRSNKAIYSHVGTLCDEMQHAGNEMHLFASGDSKTDAKLHAVNESYLDIPEISDFERTYSTELLISECYEFAKHLDIIHSHFTLKTAFFTGLVDVPTVVSVHSPIRDELKPFLRKFKSNYYVSFSHAQRKQLPDLNWFANIYHGIDTKLFSYKAKPEDYFLYIGRIVEEKGVHIAIEAAKQAGAKLVIAGRSYQTGGYWQKQIEGLIDDKQIIYVGEANLERKIELYQNAKAVLFPTQFEEPFGLVMIESMSCGTPVIGWDNGSVREVLKDGVSGYVVNDLKSMVDAMKSIDGISRQACRERAERLFSNETMVEGYLRVYNRVLEDQKRLQN
ncbi:glycosyl transferase [Candidatus Uhrbacteria bacterium CG22_combo_CG10-13_8_21_14_all_47_17]|uniref:Glycosyl transferase n=1 Tax=Candidatus Uhrbacteria bacterium CG22_combo_CG10-13_8_21_14_all_47_17 TaxID=1975041 RepID=A0A2H0BT65_9BACT|nr:MAG: glycosyl transferase [Candidatus Uhrbacteria bacterium CG22_combo_CG10-13_8_21_14_all_47_17]